MRFAVDTTVKDGSLFKHLDTLHPVLSTLSICFAFGSIVLPILIVKSDGASFGFNRISLFPASAPETSGCVFRTKDVHSTAPRSETWSPAV